MTKRVVGAYIATGLGIIILVIAGYSLGVMVGHRTPKVVTVKGLTGTSDASTTTDFSTFWEVWQTVNDNYLKAKDISDLTKVRGAEAGLVNSLGDPYSAYFTPAEAKSFKEDVSGSFSGIGAEIGKKSDQLLIIAPLKNTPAERAGLKADDKILQIDATSTDGMAVEEAIRYIRGAKGSTVKLTIYRDGWDKAKEFSIKREPIEAPTLDFKMLPGGIAYVQLYEFNANAERLFTDAANSALKQNAKGMVLDLRGNPGGYLDVAVDLSGWFLPHGSLVVKEEGRDGVILDTLKANGNEALAKMPVVVLIDKGSASASEILSGALHDDRKIKLVGETSFGKGTVQEFMDLSDGSTIKLTIAHWVLPSGRILDHDGLKPDTEVKLTDEDIAAKRDPQLDKAVEVLRSEIK